MLLPRSGSINAIVFSMNPGAPSTTSNSVAGTADSAPAAAAETTTGRWKMDRYTLEVPEGIRGGSLITAGARVWIVVDNPHFEDVPGGKPKFVVRAVSVIDDIFP